MTTNLTPAAALAYEMPQPVEHPENFPVASWLCPPGLRAPIAAIYHFARCADDIADEGDALPVRRLADLVAYRVDLHAAAAGRSTPSQRWPHIFEPLAVQMRRFALPLQPFEALLDAFEQDVLMTRDGAVYTSLEALLQYCRRSACPIGRLLLHLYAVDDAAALEQSDAICCALQLINFWQDLSVDIPRGRYYLPLAECVAHGIAITCPREQIPALQPDDARVAALLHSLAAGTRALMDYGAALVHQVPGRAGWELRLTVLGALNVLEQTRALGARALVQRPTLRATAAPLLLWRSLWM